MSLLPRLSAAALAKPRYDRAAVRPGVVHLGLGAFHRAHQAPVFDAMIAAGDPRWGIIGVAIRSPDVVAALAMQDGLYSLSVRGGEIMQPQIIGALCGLHIAAREAEAVIAAIAAPDTKIVTLTITEKGYLDHGATAPTGLLARGLERRRTAGLGPITVMSCDNRAANGPFTRAAVLTAAAAAGVVDDAIKWIGENVAFPSTMVDRITPATTTDMIDETSMALGLRDEAPVWTEPFWQWVVEDSFAAARPDFGRAGVQLASDVMPWELTKLRMLNGAHSTFAYLGLLRGHAFVHEAIADAELAHFVQALWDEMADGLDRRGIDIVTYRVALSTRFANSALPHALIQIAADGSQKLPPRLLAGMAERAVRGLPSPCLATAVAGWMLALATVSGLSDPIIDELRAIAGATGSAEQLATCLLTRVGAQASLAVQVGAALDRLRAVGGRGGLPA